MKHLRWQVSLTFSRDRASGMPFFSDPCQCSVHCSADTKFCRLRRASHPCLAAASPGQICKIAHQEHITASWAGTHCATSLLCRVLCCMVGVLNVGMHSSLPPNALLFHSSSVAREKVLPVRHLKIASNLRTTTCEHK